MDFRVVVLLGLLATGLGIGGVWYCRTLPECAEYATDRTETVRCTAWGRAECALRQVVVTEVMYCTRRVPAERP